MKAIINASLYDFEQWRPGSYLLFDEEIVEAGPMDAFAPPENLEETTDAKGAVLLPGLVISHAHLYGAFMRGCPFPPFNSTNFRERLEQLYWRLDGGLDVESSYHSALSSAADHIRCGVTTIIDHHASGTAIRGTLAALKKGWVDEAGLRGVFCFETSDRFDVEACIRENVDFYSKGGSKMHAGMFGAHASLSVSDATLDAMAEAMGDMPLHMHVAESLEDEEECLARYGKRIVHRLADKGVVNPNSLFAHCVNIDGAEAALMEQLGATAAVNVTSNMNTGNGLPDYRLLKRYGLPVTIGNDSLGTNLAADIRNTLFATHLRTQNPWWFGYGMLQGCVNNAFDYAGRLLGVGLGRLRAGYAADFALADYHPTTPINAENALGHVLDGVWNSYRPRSLWCAGVPKMRDYQVLLDEAAIAAGARKSAAALWERIGL